MTDHAQTIHVLDELIVAISDPSPLAPRRPEPQPIDVAALRAWLRALREALSSGALPDFGTGGGTGTPMVGEVPPPAPEHPMAERARRLTALYDAVDLLKAELPHFDRLAPATPPDKRRELFAEVALLPKLLGARPVPPEEAVLELAREIDVMQRALDMLVHGASEPEAEHCRHCPHCRAQQTDFGVGGAETRMVRGLNDTPPAPDLSNPSPSEVTQ